MSIDRKTIRDIPDAELRGKRVLVRVDFNVPVDGASVTDDTRIRAALPTIEYLAARGAKVLLASHLGRPKGKPEEKFSLAPVAKHLARLTRFRTTFIPHTVGGEAASAVAALGEGEVALLENTRFLEGEEKNDAALSRDLASLADIYVNDAFGAAHRAHASTAGVAGFVHPAVAGFLMEKELEYLGRALVSPERPFVGILGGAKISGKIDVLQSLLPKVDRMLIGGAMACTFLRSQGAETGKSLVEEDKVQLAGQLLSEFPEKLVLPIDAVVAPALDAGASALDVSGKAIPADMAMYDIGPRTGALFKSIIDTARTVLWNGPMGVFEQPPFDAGTRAIAHSLAAATRGGATTIVGGGDSAAAIAEAGLSDAVSHLSTGGGASLEFLEGRELPGVAALEAR